MVRAMEAAVGMKLLGVDHKLNGSPWKMTALCNCWMFPFIIIIIIIICS